MMNGFQKKMMITLIGISIISLIIIYYYQPMPLSIMLGGLIIATIALILLPVATYIVLPILIGIIEFIRIILWLIQFVLDGLAKTIRGERIFFE